MYPTYNVFMLSSTLKKEVFLGSSVFLVPTTLFCITLSNYPKYDICLMADTDSLGA